MVTDQTKAMDAGQRLELHPAIYQQWKFLNEYPVSQRFRKKTTFCIGMPRSGTTLWCRLLETACSCRCVGDKTSHFFEGVLRLYRDIKENNGQYSDQSWAQRERVFADEVRGYYSRESELYNFSYLLANMLFANTFGHGYAKTTLVGFGNKLLVPFVEMLRECFAEHDLTIVFMTRDINAAASSLINHPNNKLTEDDRANVIEAYESQLEQMRAATDLDDCVWIKYEKLIEDPMPFIRRSNPIYRPSEQLVKQVMDVVLR